VKPYTGCADGILGAGWYGYIDPQCFCYGENGHKYIYSYAGVSQKAQTDDGEHRIPIWTDKNDRLWAAFPQRMSFEVVEGPTSPYDETYVRVDHISRDPKHWQATFHPMLMESDIMQQILKVSEEANKLLAKDRDLMLNSLTPPQLHIPPIKFKPKPFAVLSHEMTHFGQWHGNMANTRSPTTGALTVDSTRAIGQAVPSGRVQLPIVDLKDGQRKMWSLSTKSSMFKKLIEEGAIKQTAQGDYYVATKIQFTDAPDEES
jgi:hypothetical protein